MATKIKCACFDCKHNSVHGNCMLKSIRLADSYYHTVNEGFKHFHMCKNYEKDEEIEEVQKEIKEWFNRKQQEIPHL